MTRWIARRIREAATISMARVICEIFLMLRMRPRISRKLATSAPPGNGELLLHYYFAYPAACMYSRAAFVSASDDSSESAFESRIVSSTCGLFARI